MKTLTAVSLFAGIEGLGRAFDLAGARVVAAVEIEAAARGVIHDRMPDTTLFTDVCEVTADELRAAGFDPDDGILLAGWPCQDLSLAGRRLGLGGARSGLFWEVVRLLGSLRPRWFCLENVPGLLSAVCPCLGGDERACGGVCETAHPVRGGACGYTPAAGGRCMELHGGAMGAVLGSLADLGYGVAYRVLDAQYFGVPQRRRRVVFVGCLGDWAAPAEVLLEPEGGGGDSAPSRAAGADVAGTLGSRTGGSRTTDLDGHGAYVPVGALGSAPGGADDNDAQGGRLIAGPLQAQGMAFDWQASDGERVYPNVSTEHTSALGTTRQDAVAYQCHGTNVGPAGALRKGNGHTTGGVPFLPTDATAVRRLTPLEAERLQGYPDGWTLTSWGKPQSDSARYRELGNSVAVPVFEWCARRIVAAHAQLRPALNQSTKERSA